MNKIIISIILGVLLLSGISFAFVSGYQSRIPINVSSNAGSDITNFTYILNYSEFMDIQNLEILDNCFDIRITETDDSLLDWEFEDYDDSVYGCNTTDTLIWVRTLSLAANNTTSHFFQYNNSGETNLGNDTINAWNNGYIMIHHLSYNNTTDYFDSSGNDLDFTLRNDTSKWNETNTIFGNGVHFNKTWSLESPYTLDFEGMSDGTTTIEFWFNTESASTGDDWIMDRWSGVALQKNFLFLFTNNKIRFIGYNTTNTETDLFSTGTLSTDTWYYIAVTQNTTDLLLYINGVLNNTTAFADVLKNTSDPLYVASQFGALINTPDNAFIDEIRIHNDSLSADYFARQYANGIEGMTSLGESESAVVGKTNEEIFGFTELSGWLMIFLILLPIIGVIIALVK